MHRRRSRRRVLAATGTAGLVALAGCSGVLSDGDDPENDDPDDQPANDAADDAEGNASDGDDAEGDGSSPTEDGNDAADDETPPMPEPVDWTGEERGTILVGSSGEFVFESDAVRITPGTLVRWLWESDGHSVTPIDQPADANWDGEPDTYDENHTYEFAFETPGTYEYVCGPHEGSAVNGTRLLVSGMSRETRTKYRRHTYRSG